MSLNSWLSCMYLLSARIPGQQCQAWFHLLALYWETGYGYVHGLWDYSCARNPIYQLCDLERSTQQLFSSFINWA